MLGHKGCIRIYVLYTCIVYTEGESPRGAVLTVAGTVCIYCGSVCFDAFLRGGLGNEILKSGVMRTRDVSFFFDKLAFYRW